MFGELQRYLLEQVGETRSKRNLSKFKIAVNYWFCRLSTLKEGRHVVAIYRSRRDMLDVLIYRGSGQASLNSNSSKFCLLLNGNTDTP